MRCENLTRINLPSGITNIEKSAFSSCKKLVKITIPNSVKVIGDNAFSGCTNLVNIVIPNGVEKMGDSVFHSCKKLKVVELPDSLINMGADVFDNCNNLKYNEYDNAYYLGNAHNPYLYFVKIKDRHTHSLIFNDSTKIINRDLHMFFWLKELEVNKIRYDNAFYIGSNTNPYFYLLKASNEAITSCQINGQTKFIHCFAFSGCTKLSSLVIEEGVGKIMSEIFNSYTLKMIYAYNPDILPNELKFTAFYTYISKREESFEFAFSEECYQKFAKQNYKKILADYADNVQIYSYLIEHEMLPVSSIDDYLSTVSSVEIKAMLLQYKEKLMAPQNIKKIEKHEKRQIEKNLSDAPMTVSEAKKNGISKKMETGLIQYTVIKGRKQKLLSRHK